VTAWWLANIADVRVHRETRQRPIDRHAEERPYLIALPAASYDSDGVVYRVVNVEGFIAYQQNFYSVPFRHIGCALAVRVGETELTVYGPALEAVARHRLLPRSVRGQRCEDKAHRPSSDPRQHEALLRERFTELGPAAVSFLDGLLQHQRQGRHQAGKVLVLLSHYARADLVAALERAVRFGAYSLAAVERILAVQAQPRSILETLSEQHERQLPSWLRDNPVSQRPVADYLHLVEEPTDHDTPQQPRADAGDASVPPSDSSGGSA
jgi:Mu transposase-like protein